MMLNIIRIALFILTLYSLVLLAYRMIEVAKGREYDAKLNTWIFVFFAAIFYSVSIV